MSRTTFLLLVTVALFAAPAAEAWRAQWVWHPDEGLTDVYLRIPFELDSPAVDARCVVTADNRYTLYVNGRRLGWDAGWTSMETYRFAEHLRVGRNVLTLHGGDDGGGAAGLVLDGLIWCENGQAVAVSTGGDHRIAKTEIQGWLEPDFDDSGWPRVRVQGHVGMPPWGDFERPEWFRMRGRVFSGGFLGSAMPGEVLDVTLELELDGPVPQRGPVDLVFQLLDQDAWVARVQPEPPVEEWLLKKRFIVRFSGIETPVWLPRCELQVFPRMADLDLRGAAAIRFGAQQPAPPAVRTAVTRARLREAGRTLDLEATFTPSGPLPEDFSWYAALYRERELWFADSFAADSTPAPGGPATVSRAVALPPLPEGTYRLVVGVHRTPVDPAQDTQVAFKQESGRFERPYGYGTFVDKFDTPHFWYINPYGTIIWDGEPFIPVGGMYLPKWCSRESGPEQWAGDLQWMGQLRQAGIRDLYFNPCQRAIDHPSYVWQTLLDIGEEADMTYCWDFPMHVDDLHAFHIEARDYLVDADADGNASAFVPSGYFGRTNPANRVLYAAFDAERDALLETGYATVREARRGIEVHAQVKNPVPGKTRIHFIPELVYSGDMHDYWTSVTDQYVWEVQKMLRRLRPGPNFRGFIDPLDNEQSFRDQQRMLPACAAFRDQLAFWLLQRYGAIETLAAAWAVDPAPRDFFEAAGAVPLGTARPDSAAGWALSLRTGRTFRVDLERSQLWDDLMQFRDDSIRDYNNQLADAVKAVVDAPVLMKLTELHAFTNNQTVGGFDALGLEAYGDAPELVRGCGGGVYARSVQAGRTMWMLVTETGFARTDLAPIGYPDPLRLIHELTSQVEYGARGTYYFVFVPSRDDSWGIFNLFADDRQLAWMGAFSDVMKNSRDLPTHRPWVDFSFPQKQVGPTGFRRPTPDFHGTPPHVSVISTSGKWVFPVVDLPGIDPAVSRARLVVNLERPPATERYADTLRAALESDWPVVMVGLRHDLGPLAVDRYYTDRFAEDADGRRVQIVSPPRGATVTHSTPDGEPFGFETERLSVIAKEGWDYVVRNLPGTPRTASVDAFTQEVLNAEFIDLGPAFQAIRTRDTTFLWNISAAEARVSVAADEPMTVAVPGHEEPAGGQREAELALAPNAARTYRIDCAAPLRISGTDEANRAFLAAQWQALETRAATQEIALPAVPPDADWRVLLALVAEWDDKVTDLERTALVAPAPELRIDGDLSDWGDVPEIPIDRWKNRDFVEEVPPLPETGVRLAYDDGGLLFAVRVRDDRIANNHRGANLWNGDCFEIFMETVLEPGRTDRAYDSDTYHFVFAPTSADDRPAMCLLGHPTLLDGTVPDGIEWRVVTGETGWTIEGRMTPEALFGWRPRAGETIGFSFVLGDSDGGDRDKEFPWQNTVNMSWHRLDFGRLRFVE